MQTLYCKGQLEIDPNRYNVNGSGISVSHPYGMTGTRLVGHALLEGKRRQTRRGVNVRWGRHRSGGVVRSALIEWASHRTKATGPSAFGTPAFEPLSELALLIAQAVSIGNPCWRKPILSSMSIALPTCAAIFVSWARSLVMSVTSCATMR